MGSRANFARISAMLFTDNLRCIGDLIHGGVCHRFPTLNFVSVESGVSMLPGALESFDWQWRNGGVAEEHPEYELLPSEYFRRQIHGCFWYERETITTPLLAYPDNMLFETDFPHPTCQHPGPRTPAVYPEQYASSALGALPDDVLREGADHQRRGAVRRTTGRMSEAPDLERVAADAGRPRRSVTRRATVSGVHRTSAGFSRENWVFEVSYTVAGRPRTRAAHRPPGPGRQRARHRPAGGNRACFARWRTTDVPSPPLRWADVEGSRLGRPSIVMDLVPGYCDGFVLAGDAPLEERLALAHHLYDYLADIHLLDWRALGLGDVLRGPGRQGGAGGRGPLGTELRKVALEPQPELAYIMRLAAPARSRLPDDHVGARRFQGRQHAPHAGRDRTISSLESAAILDWETAHLGDPREDLGWVTNPLRAREHTIPGSWEPADLLARWEQRTGLQAEPRAVHWWRVLANLKLAVIVLSGINALVDGRLDRIHQTPGALVKLMLRMIGD